MKDRNPARERWHETIERWFGQSLLQDEAGRSGAFRYAFLGSTALILAAVWILGPYPITIFPSDTMYFLVQGDYLVRGYRPYVDYYSLHAFFPFLFSAIGIELQGISMRAVLLAQMFGGGMLGVVLHRVAASRVHPMVALLLGLSAVLMLVSCTPIGYETWRAFSCAMWYNRVGFALQAIVLVYVVLPCRDPRGWSRWLDSLIAGFCLAALLHTKLTFFVPTMLTAIVGTILWPRAREQRIHGIVMVVVALISGTAAMALLRGSLPGYFKLLWALPMKVGILALVCRYAQFTRTLSVFSIAMLALTMAASRAGLVRAIWREWLLAVLMAGTLVLSVATAAQNEEIIPFLGVVPVTVAVALARLARNRQVEVNRPLGALAVILALSMLVHVPKDAALSWVFSRASVETLGPGEWSAGVHSISDARLPRSDRIDPFLLANFPEGYGKRIRAALTLLEEVGGKPGEVLFVATTADDVTLLTNMRYAKGGTPWWQLFLVDDPVQYPSPNRDFLADADWILRDKNDPVSFGHEVWRLIEHSRGAYLREHFQVAKESDDWIVYRRIFGP